MTIETTLHSGAMAMAITATSTIPLIIYDIIIPPDIVASLPRQACCRFREARSL